MKTIYKVLAMNCYENEEYFFSSKRLAIGFLSKTIKEREARKDQLGRPFPDRDWYDGKMEEKIQALLLKKKWEELAPIFSLYLYKIPLNNSLKNVKVMDGNQNERITNS